MRPTSLGFFGVGDKKINYDGILYELELQLADTLTTTITVAVYPNEHCVMLLGNDMIGGPNAKVSIIMMSAMYSAYVLCDRKGTTGIVHYIKNIEGAAFPAPPLTNNV